VITNAGGEKELLIPCFLVKKQYVLSTQKNYPFGEGVSKKIWTMRPPQKYGRQKQLIVPSYAKKVIIIRKK